MNQSKVLSQTTKRPAAKQQLAKKQTRKKQLVKSEPVSKKSNWPIILILFLAFLLRLYRLNYPLLDWHSFRQADTASVTREYLKAGQIDWLRPQYHDLSNIQSGKANPEGYRMVEFPIINALIAQFLLICQNLGFNLDLVIVSRLFSILASLLAIYALYRLILLIDNRPLALLSAFIYAVMPYAVYYGRAILPEPFMLTFSLLSLWQWAAFCREKSLQRKDRNELKILFHYFSSLITLALAALLKPFVAFLAPVYLAIAWLYFEAKVFKQFYLYLFPLLAFFPLLWWRQWISNFPEGIPASAWLFNQNNIRLRPAWWRWLFYERLTKLFLGFTGVILLLANSCKARKTCLIYASWWLSIILYLIVLASGNVQHDYYQNLLIPIVALSMARGSLILREKFQKPLIGNLVIFLLISSSIFLSAQKIAGYFNVNTWEYREAGQAVDRLTPSNALVIAPAMGDTAFLFQTNRRGWPIGFAIEEKIAQGATIYVSINDDDERRDLAEKYQTVEEGERYLILDLTKEKDQ
jgi:4-amino-4-deoxy-L-arabinose transferase-like glycosyltransferase